MFSSYRLHGEKIKFKKKQPSDLLQSCAQPSRYGMEVREYLG